MSTTKFLFTKNTGSKNSEALFKKKKKKKKIQFWVFCYFMYVHFYLQY